MPTGDPLCACGCGAWSGQECLRPLTPTLTLGELVTPRFTSRDRYGHCIMRVEDPEPDQAAPTEAPEPATSYEASPHHWDFGHVFPASDLVVDGGPSPAAIYASARAIEDSLDRGNVHEALEEVRRIARERGTVILDDRPDEIRRFAQGVIGSSYGHLTALAVTARDLRETMARESLVLGENPDLANEVIQCLLRLLPPGQGMPLPISHALFTMLRSVPRHVLTEQLAAIRATILPRAVQNKAPDEPAPTLWERLADDSPEPGLEPAPDEPPDVAPDRL